MAASPVVNVEGLSETLAVVRPCLDAFGKVAKVDLFNRRLIVLRNLVIAISVLAAAGTIAITALREAYRQTLTIFAFDVPTKLADRGITGEVVAKRLFDELILRRKEITTLDAGELRSARADRQSDVAVPQSGLTLQSIFRYLRHLTGREVAIDGEMMLDGDDVTVTVVARVAGNPPHRVEGKLKDWEKLLGDLANYVFETTQPVVLARYLGLTAKGAKDLTALSQLIQRMSDSEPRAAREALAVAYHAYGEALDRQNKSNEALMAWERSRAYDPNLAAPYFSVAYALVSSDPEKSDKFFKDALKLNVSEVVKQDALSRRFFLATNRYDCVRMKEVLDELKQLVKDPQIRLHRLTASFLERCEYQHANAVSLAKNLVDLHPDNVNYLNSLGAIYAARPDKKYLKEAQSAFAGVKAVEVSPQDRVSQFNRAFSRISHVVVSARLGDDEAVKASIALSSELFVESNANGRYALAVVRIYEGNYDDAERLLRRNMADKRSVRAPDYEELGNVLDARGRPDEAIKILREGIVRFPLYCPIYDATARMLLKAGREGEAFAEWEAGISAIPKCDVNYTHYARALIKLNRLPEARKLLDQLLKVSPLSDGAEEAKKILGGLP